MKQVFIVLAFLMATSTAFATDAPPQSQGPETNFAEMKSNAINSINARITRNLKELSCVLSASDHQDLKACSEKFREEGKEQREHNREDQREQ